MNDVDEQLTPIERPLLRSDLNKVSETIHSMETLLLQWYEENKQWRKQSDELVVRVARIEQRLWLPTIVGIAAAALAVLARLTP